MSNCAIRHRMRREGVSPAVTILERSERTARHTDLAAAQNPLRRKAVLTLGALGIVYGDIGTSPLYAFRESVLAVQSLPDHTSAVLGIASLIFWSLLIVVTVKYVIFILRADNHGEGGVLALSQL